MNAIGNQSLPVKVPPRKRSLPDTIAAIEEIAARSLHLRAQKRFQFETRDGQTCQLPSYVFLGPQGGDEPIRIGLFAGIHGDEPEGTYALIQLLKLLESKPELATGYCLFIYPICNPTGFEDNTRFSRIGKDLNREFWNKSSEPEVQFLESELASRRFQGIISLHTDDTSDGFYGFVRGATLSKHLIEPALKAAEEFLPRNGHDRIDGFEAIDGIIHQGYSGVLSAPPDTQFRPFEIILETTKTSAEYLKESAFVLALQTILVEYQKFIAFARNL
jgi:murein peptide amidase A